MGPKQQDPYPIDNDDGMDCHNEDNSNLLQRVREVELQLRGSLDRNKLLEERLQDALAENLRKDAIIENLQRRLQMSQGNEEQFELRVDTEDENDNVVDSNHRVPHEQRPQHHQSSDSARYTIEEIQRFLFMEARHVIDAQSMMEAYSTKLIQLGIPIDRFFVGGVVDHPKALAYAWKWQKSGGFQEHRVPRNIFDKLKDSNEPFALLYHGKTSKVRIRKDEVDEIPYDSQWFVDEGYVDYLALPMTFKGRFLGGIAHATKHSDGFTDEQIKVFNELQNELSTVMAHHIHDKAMTYLTKVLEEEVADRTKELAITNKTLEEANSRIIRQSKAQLRHFAMMSHEIRYGML